MADCSAVAMRWQPAQAAWQHREKGATQATGQRRQQGGHALKPVQRAGQRSVATAESCACQMGFKPQTLSAEKGQAAQVLHAGLGAAPTFQIHARCFFVVLGPSEPDSGIEAGCAGPRHTCVHRSSLLHAGQEVPVPPTLTRQGVAAPHAHGAIRAAGEEHGAVGFIQLQVQMDSLGKVANVSCRHRWICEGRA